MSRPVKEVVQLARNPALACVAVELTRARIVAALLLKGQAKLTRLGLGWKSRTHDRHLARFGRTVARA